MAVLLALAAGACATSGAAETSGSGPLLRSPAPAVAPTSSTTVASSTTTAAPTTVAAPTTTASTTTTTSAPPPRDAQQTGFSPYATVGDIVLHHPAAVVERIGFHESNHEGAQVQTALDTAVHPFTMESRGRLTAQRTAADIVVAPDTEIRAPATGTVKRAGGYTLYCKYRDDYLVIAPDARPEWEVKLLHFQGLRVHTGDRVEAGVTVVGDHAHVLPFASQVEEGGAVPVWPHVHVEVVDPSIPNVPSPGGGCS